MNKDELLAVAKLGKTHGLKGELKLHDLSDFPTQYGKGAKFFCEGIGELEVESYSHEKGFIKFISFSSKEDAAKLTNRHLYLSIEKTEQNIELGENDLFYHQVIGFKIVDEGIPLGEVTDVNRIGNIDYLEVASSFFGEEKNFLLPYIDRYVVSLHKQIKEIHTKDVRELFEES